MTRIQSFSGLVLAALLLTTLAGCPQPPTDPGRPEPETANVRVLAAFKAPATARIQPSDVARVLASATWADGDSPEVEMFLNGSNQYEVTIQSLPVGTPVTISVRGLDSGNAQIYSGQYTNLTLSADQTTDILLDLIPADSNINEGLAPRIDNVLRPNEDIPVSTEVQLQFLIADPDDPNVSFQLSSNRGGSFNPASGNHTIAGSLLSTIFTTPSTPGPVDVTLVVTDSANLIDQVTFTINVVAFNNGIEPGAVRLTVNFAPTVQAVQIRKTQGTSDLAITAVATDDGPTNFLTYAWVINGVNKSGMTVSQPSGVGIVQAQLTVADAAGASTVLRFAIDTEPTSYENLPLTNHPPVIAGAAVSRTTVPLNGLVTLIVYASDQDMDVLDGAWNTDRGQFQSTTTGTEGDLQKFVAVWQAGPNPGVATIRLTITDPSGDAVIYTFKVTQIVQ